MDIIFKNFSLFEKRTNFEIAPLTILIGGNSSGKSTFLKGLSIMTSQSIWRDKKYDLGSIEFHTSNSSAPISLYFRTYRGLYREIIFKGMAMNSDEYATEIEDSDTISLRYVNQNFETVLEVNQNLSVLEEHSKGVQVKLNMQLYFEVLIENELMNTVNYFKAHGFKDKLYTALLPNSEKRIFNKEKFETWFFEKGFIEFLNIISENDLSQVVELYDFKNEFFSPTYTNKNKPLHVLRLKEFGYPKRVFSSSDDMFGKLLNESYEHRYYSDFAHIGHFQRKWIKLFFGENSEFRVDPLNKLHSHYEVKLNDRYLTEHGMGVFKLLYLIYHLSHYYEDPEFNFEVDQGKIKAEDLINRTLELKKKRPVNQNNYLVIEEPETNLHPDYQVILADMLYEFATHSDYHLIVETHSEYIVRKLQVLTANQKKENDLIRILNFGNKENLGKIKVIKIRKNGGLSDSFFPGFYDVAHELQYQLLLANGSYNN